MQSINIVREVKIKNSGRVKQISAMFDVPLKDKSSLKWEGELDFDEKEWSVGLIVGPSGCGKSTLLKELFGEMTEMEWGSGSVIDDFSEDLSMPEIASGCQSVGFNTIPAWTRPYHVLSNGEKFRVDMARRLLEIESLIVVDEFTSVVDRQVAKIASHAVQKFARRENKKMVVASCHYDVIDWLQPDWVLEPHNMKLKWRRLRRRPEVKLEIRRVPYSTWELFSRYHYMSAKLNKSARCYAGFIDGKPVTFCAVLHFPHPKVNDIKRGTRIVTLPDYQGLGLAFVMWDFLGSCYKADGKRLRGYPSHPYFVRNFQKSKLWKQTKKLGTYSRRSSSSSSSTDGLHGGRASAVFEYIGPPAKVEIANKVIHGIYIPKDLPESGNW